MTAGSVQEQQGQAGGLASHPRTHPSTHPHTHTSSLKNHLGGSVVDAYEVARVGVPTEHSGEVLVRLLRPFSHEPWRVKIAEVLEDEVYRRVATLSAYQPIS